MKKLLAIGIIFLFIGVAVAPSINSSVVKVSDNLVEVTSQACGIQGFGNTTVKLTKQQYQNLEQYLVEFRARLNQTTTKDEAIPIFKDAVVDLNKYGLLPKGMSLQRVQDIVTGNSIPKRTHPILEKIAQREDYINTNALVYINGEIDENLNLLLMFVLLWTITPPYSPPDSLLWRFANWYSGFKPVNFFSFTVFFYSAQLYSIGQMGKKQFDNITDLGLVGFIGLQIITRYQDGWPERGIYLGWSAIVN